MCSDGGGTPLSAAIEWTDRMPEIAPRARNHNTQAPLQNLSDVSAKDKPWDNHRSTCADVSVIMKTAPDDWIEAQGERLHDCSRHLLFDQLVDPETGEISLRLDTTRFCRVRACPVCQWRRSLMWKARMYQSLPEITEAHPSGRWLFLTLTVKNCPIGELRAQLAAMSAGWNRLRGRKALAPVLGWVRATEITRGKDASAHPHYHVLLFVKSTYFKGTSYISQARWTEMWRDVMRLDYDPVVDVRAVKDKGPGGLRGAIAETLKYAVKSSDMVADSEWFLEMTRQVRKTRAIAAGGILKEVFRDEDDADDLIHTDEETEAEAEPELPGLSFSYRHQARRYQRERDA